MGIIGRWSGSWIYETKEFNREGCAKWCLRNQDCKAFNYVWEEPLEQIGNCQFFDEDISIYQEHDDGIQNVQYQGHWEWTIYDCNGRTADYDA